MKVYYAHSMGIYGTVQEKRDVEALEKLGFEVVNPADHEDIVVQMREQGSDSADIMDYFVSVVEDCDAVAFRALPGGMIPAGVYKEVRKAQKTDKPVIELPSSVTMREMTVEQTREYLHEIGQR